MIRFEGIVGDTAQTGVSRVQAAGLLVQVGIGDVSASGRPNSDAPAGLECIGTAVPEVSVAEQEIAQIREGQTRQVRTRKVTVIPWSASRRVPSPVVVPKGLSLGGTSFKSTPAISPLRVLPR